MRNKRDDTLEDIKFERDWHSNYLLERAKEYEWLIKCPPFESTIKGKFLIRYFKGVINIVTIIMWSLFYLVALIGIPLFAILFIYSVICQLYNLIF